jgi:hypothetical protein
VQTIYNSETGNLASGGIANSCLEEILKYSWPYLTVSYAIKAGISETFELICVLEITAMASDLLNLINSNSNLKFIGVAAGILGTIYKLPISKYTTRWHEFTKVLDKLTNFINAW